MEGALPFLKVPFMVLLFMKYLCSLLTRFFVHGWFEHFQVPLKVELNVGERWGSMKPYLFEGSPAN